MFLQSKYLNIKNIFFLFLALAAFSCNRTTSKKDSDWPNPDKARESVEAIYNKPQEPKLDSLRDPKHHKYLTDLPIRQVAELILCDSISPSDNDITFSVLEMYDKSTGDEKDFYFKVLIEILKVSDGALTEMVCDYVWRITIDEPKICIDYLKNVENKMVKKWGDCLLFHLDGTYPEDSLIFYSNSLISNLKQVNGNSENKGLGTIEKYILSVLNGADN